MYFYYQIYLLKICFVITTIKAVNGVTDDLYYILILLIMVKKVIGVIRI